jgi:hypothetical protein
VIVAGGPGAGRAVLRLQEELGGWADYAARASLAGGLTFPCAVEFSRVAGGRPAADFVV